MFQGHRFVMLVNEEWVLDLTEFKGYKVKLTKDGTFKGYSVAFKAKYEGGDVVFDKFIRVPVKVLRAATLRIEDYNSKLEECLYEQ